MTSEITVPGRRSKRTWNFHFCHCTKLPSNVKFLPSGCVMRIGFSAGRNPYFMLTVASSNSAVSAGSGTTPVSITCSTTRSSRSMIACMPSIGFAYRLIAAFSR